MKISKSHSVRPPKLDDKDLSLTFGRVLGKLGDDAIYAVMFREAEIRVAQAVRREWAEVDNTVTSDLETNSGYYPNMSGRGWDSVHDEVVECLQADRSYLENERILARAHLALCDRVIAALSEVNAPSAFTQAYDADGPRGGIALRHLGGSIAAARRATARLEAADQAWTEGYNRLVARGVARNRFAATPESVLLSRIDAESPESFEQVTALLLQRDGCTIERDRGGPGDLGADVIAVTPEGLRIVVQCKHSIKPRNRLDPRHVYELNGTARPVHGADIVGIVTNRALSDGAATFAESQAIHVIDRPVLKRWATYGVPWWKPEQILELPAITPAETPIEHTAA